MPSSNTRTIPGRQYSVSDGRMAAGVIEPTSSAGFVAFDATSQLIGTFQTLTAASRALPTAVASS